MTDVGESVTLEKQLTRVPRPFPKLKILRDVKDISNFTVDDFKLEGYKPHNKIEMLEYDILK